MNIEGIKDLLEQKNQYLEEFSLLNTKQINHLRSRKMIFVEKFYKKRELILKNIKKVDKELKECSEKIDVRPNLSPRIKKEIENLIQKRETIVRNILNQDMEILSRIDLEKCSLIYDLHEGESLFQELQEELEGQTVEEVQHLKKS